MTKDKQKRANYMSTMNIFQIIITGVGGQGVITLGKLFRDYSLISPIIIDMVASESRGVSQREGSVYTCIKYLIRNPGDLAENEEKSNPDSKKEIKMHENEFSEAHNNKNKILIKKTHSLSPSPKRAATDLFIAIEPLEFIRHLNWVKEESKIIINTQPIIPKSSLQENAIKYPEISKILDEFKEKYPSVWTDKKNFFKITQDNNLSTISTNLLMILPLPELFPELFPKKAFYNYVSNNFTDFLKLIDLYDEIKKSEE